MAAETTVQIECPCGWIVRISGWMAAWKAEQLVAAHRCEESGKGGTSDG